MFAELSLPITDSFQAQLAARYEDYGSGIGSTFDPKLSLRWQLVDSFALRGSVGTTFRGPALQQADPNSVTSLQNVAGTFRAIRTFGNPNLKPENAFDVQCRHAGQGRRLQRIARLLVIRLRAARLVNEPVARHHELRIRHGRHVRRRSRQPAGGPLRLPRRASNDGVINDADCTTANIARLDINVFNGPEREDRRYRSQRPVRLGHGGLARPIGLNATYVLKYDIDATFVDGNRWPRRSTRSGQLNYQTTAFPLPQLKGNVFAEYSNGRAQHPLTR